MVAATGFSQNTGRPAATAARVRAGTASVTTSWSTTGRSVRVWAWNPPILPNPIRPSRMLVRLLSVQTAEDVLVPIDDRPGDHAAAVRQQKDHEVGDLVHLSELAHGQGPGRLLPP